MHTLAIKYAHTSNQLCTCCIASLLTMHSRQFHVRSRAHAPAASHLCSKCAQNSSTSDHLCTSCMIFLLKLHSKQLHVRSRTHMHLLHHITAQNALKTASRQITNAPAAWHFCSKCTQNSSRWAWLHWFRGQPAGRSWSRSTAASPKHRPKPRLIPVRVLERRGCAWLPWWDLYSDINIVAQLRLQSIVPSHAWFLCVCWREEGVLDFDGETYTVILIS